LKRRAPASISQPAAVLRGVGHPTTGGINTWHRCGQLTVLNIVWSPLMQLMPHEHRMWSVIGIYTGREDNIFWRRQGDSVIAAQGRALAAGEPVALDADVIHSVTNPIAKLTGAIHIYGGDFFARPRSEWDPETLAERPWDVQEAVRIFRESNERFAAWQSARNCA
jgi:predicted metal-dependent enzyme (double-stranded beta helix superfamily)